MQIIDNQTQGLSKEYQLIWTAAEIDAKIDHLIRTKYSKVNMPGFRPGKAPLKMLKARFGNSLLPEILDAMVQDGTQQLTTDKDFKDVLNLNTVPDAYEPGGDLSIKVEIDLRPEIKAMDFSKIALTELKAIPSAEKLDEILADVAKQNRAKKEVSRKAKIGDSLEIDFEGYLNDIAFPGGKGENAPLEIGAKRFIPGFEENFIGKKADDDVVFDITFPSDYSSENLAGQTTKFVCKVKKVMEFEPRAIDDNLAKDLGLQDLAELKAKLQEDYSKNLASHTQEKLQIELMDALDEAHDFELPNRMVEREFNNIWPRIQHAMEHKHLDPEDQDKDEATLRADYNKIAQRRVRLGLLLADVSKRGSITTNEEEVRNHLIRRITEMPQAQQREMIEMMGKDRNQLTNMFQAELLENKTIEFIREQANITVKHVPEDELMTILFPDGIPTQDHNHDHDHDHDHDHHNHDHHDHNHDHHDHNHDHHDHNHDHHDHNHDHHEHEKEPSEKKKVAAKKKTKKDA